VHIQEIEPGIERENWRENQRKRGGGERGGGGGDQKERERGGERKGPSLAITTMVCSEFA